MDLSYLVNISYTVGVDKLPEEAQDRIRQALSYIDNIDVERMMKGRLGCVALYVDVDRLFSGKNVESCLCLSQDGCYYGMAGAHLEEGENGVQLIRYDGKDIPYDYVDSTFKRMYEDFVKEDAWRRQFSTMKEAYQRILDDPEGVQKEMEALKPKDLNGYPMFLRYMKEMFYEFLDSIIEGTDVISQDFDSEEDPDKTPVTA